MSLKGNHPELLEGLRGGDRACFFYTTQDSFYAVAAPFLNRALKSVKERALWVLPPGESFVSGKKELQRHIRRDLDVYLYMRRLMILPWDQWYGREISVRSLLQLGRRMLKETLDDGYFGLRFLGHAPAKSSPYWHDFMVYQEDLVKARPLASLISLTAYDLRNTHLRAVTPLAADHDYCLIHCDSGLSNELQS